MKKIMLLALALVLAIALLGMTACDVISLGPPAGSVDPDTPSDPDIPGEDIPDPDPEPNPEPEPEPEPEVETVDLCLRDAVSYELIKRIKVEKGSAPTEEQLDQIEAVYFHGYKFVSWHYGVFFNTYNVFDPEAVLTEPVTIYGNRGNLAGEDITWSYDSDSLTLTISGSGKMFDFQYYQDVPWSQYAKLAEKIVLDGDITEIGDHSFYGFTAIDIVKFPDTVTRIGNNAFCDSSITDVNFPLTLKTIDDRAFYRCAGLTELVFNQGLIDIGHSAFYECVGVTRVTLTNEIALLGFSAFYGCTNLRSAYYFGTEEEYDNLQMLLDNKALEMFANTYFISDTKPDAPGPYWRYDDSGEIEQWYYTVSFFVEGEVVPFLYDYIDVDGAVTQENVDFMNSIVYHGYKFARFKGFNYVVGAKLTGDVKLYGSRGNLCGDDLTWSFRGTTLTISGTGAMWDFETSADTPWRNRNVVNIVIGDGVTHLGKNMVSELSSLVGFDVPINVTSIHPNAITGCINLKYIYYQGTAEQLKSVLGVSELKLPQSTKVYSYLAEGSTEGYHWRDVIGGMEYAPKRVAWSVMDGVLTVGGDASLVNYSSITETPWYESKDLITSVVILPGANRVGYNSFFGMSGVTDITIASTVLKIAESAFEGTGLYNDKSNWVGGALYVSNHLIKVDSTAVGDTFVIRDGTLSVAENAFEDCTQIKQLVFSKDTIGIFKGALAPLSLEKIFFSGMSIDTWNAIWASANDLASQEIDGVPIYCLSPSKPNGEGLFWQKQPKSDGTFDIYVWPEVTAPEQPEPTPDDGGQDEPMIPEEN